jgi:hypothetical protein
MRSIGSPAAAMARTASAVHHWRRRRPPVRKLPGSNTALAKTVTASADVDRAFTGAVNAETNLAGAFTRPVNASSTLASALTRAVNGPVTFEPGVTGAQTMASLPVLSKTKQKGD